MFEPYRAALLKWAGEIRLAVKEWLEDNPDSGVAPAGFPVALCGVGATQPGLIEFLNRSGTMRFVAWEAQLTQARPWPMADYLVPYGAALLAMGRSPHPVSLLPQEDRLPRQRRRLLAMFQTAAVGLLLAVALLLAHGTRQKLGLIEKKRELTTRSRDALQTAVAIDQLYRQLKLEYAEAYPVLERQRQMLELLQTLAAMRAARTNEDFWYVLFADAASYLAGKPGAAPAEPNPSRSAPTTNAPAPPNREYVVEVCAPHEGEKLRRTLSDLVANLKQQAHFARVDSLPPERRRDLNFTNVIVSNRVFSIAMEVGGPRLAPPGPDGEPAGGGREARRPAASRSEAERPSAP
jgi:hypothetical protein